MNVYYQRSRGAISVELTPSAQKKLHLDPPAVKEDHTITDYHSRVSLLLPADRVKLMIHYPFTDALKEVKVGATKHSSIDRVTESSQERLSSIERRNDELGR